MQTFFTRSIYMLLCISAVCFSACSSNEGEDIQKNTFTVDGVEYMASSTGYIENDDSTITLYFGNNRYGSATQSIHIKINADEPQEGHYYFSNSTGNIIHSASYKSVDGDDETELSDISQGAITLIQFDTRYIVNYELTINGCKISGHHTGFISLIN